MRHSANPNTQMRKFVYRQNRKSSSHHSEL
jgi:hypothetical protein